MRITLDTNTLIRFFTNDEHKKAKRVRELLEKEKNLYIPDVVFPELEYILSGQYNLSRAEIILKFEFLSSQNSISISLQIKKAISIYRITKLDMADCIIVAYSFNGFLASFDKEMLNIEGIKPQW
jgi:predicted nucleic-acid-binding protein